jgi:hypothetical protein
MVCGEGVFYYSGFLDHWFKSKHSPKIFRRKCWELVGEMNEKDGEISHPANRSE